MRRIALYVLLGVLAFVALVGVLDVTTRSPKVCASCHEMQAMVSAWQVSGHSEVRCFSCHAPARPWYLLPVSLVDRGALLARDVGSHFTGSWESSVGAIATTTSTIVPDENCLRCHDPERTGTSRFGVQVQHAKHAERNKSCTSCHLWTAHPLPSGDRDTLMMERCFNCHSLDAGAKAPGRCDVCHLKGLDLHPDSHKQGEWLKRHGNVYLGDKRQCVMCHRQPFCDACHGLKMPHPGDWVQGENLHAETASRDRKVCEQCHVGETNLCTMCHHKGYDDKSGPWVGVHFNMVRKTGSAFCMQCHKGSYCVDCHRARGGSGPLDL
ncbi:MAG: hypothetical protein HGB10_05935 [Coriobacteriia bacterium]|nr:hypothetical protein [Coriobacteriia bacterium]